LDLCTAGPAAIRFPKTMPPDDAAAPSEGGEEVGSGLSARKVRTGRDVCILAVGKMLASARAAAEAMASSHGIQGAVWDVRLVKPLDEEMLAEAVTYPHVITVEDGYRDGGAGSAIADRLAGLATGEEHEDGPHVTVLGVPVRFIPHGKPDDILASVGLDADGIAATVRAVLGR
ncbi:MAG TPA: transketolase C-terminal domain-containing protein, partial [Acidimicrobiales bacterium]